MKKPVFRIKTIGQFAFLALLVAISVGLVYGMPVFAAKCGGAEVSILGCDDNEGGIWHILNLVIDILSIGIGILGVVGILVVGIQILTSKDNPEQIKKAKTRLFQIVIGLALYAVLFALSQWLLPGGLLNAESSLKNVGTTTQVEEIEKQQEEARKKQEEEAGKDTDSGGGSSGGSNGDSGEGSDSGKSKAEQIASTAWQIVSGNLSYNTVAKANGYYKYMKKHCVSMGGGCCNGGKRGYRTFCSGFVYNVIRYTGVDSKYPMKLTGKQMAYLEKSKKWKNVTKKVNGRTSKLKPGDVLIRDGHTLIITQNSKGQLYTAQANVCHGSSGGFQPKKAKIIGGSRLDNSAGNLNNYKVFRIVE